MNEYGGRYCLTYEEWLEDLQRSPEAYGYTYEQARAELMAHYDKSTQFTEQGNQNGTSQEA